jgi:hypothetical protein
MLFALRQPGVLLGLVLGFAAGCMLRVAGQRLVAGGPRPLSGFGSPRTWLDPYGTVAALLTGVGWSVRPARRRSGRLWAMVITAVVAHLIVAVIGVLAYLAAGGPRIALTFFDTVSVLHGTQLIAVTTAQRVSIGVAAVNIGCALLALVPLPPLEAGVALWSTVPRAPGARRLAYHLLEEQWGVAVLLVLLLVPLAGEQPLLLALVAAVADPIMHAL